MVFVPSALLLYSSHTGCTVVFTGRLQWLPLIFESNAPSPCPQIWWWPQKRHFATSKTRPLPPLGLLVPTRSWSVPVDNIVFGKPSHSDKQLALEPISKAAWDEAACTMGEFCLSLCAYVCVCACVAVVIATPVSCWITDESVFLCPF